MSLKFYYFFTLFIFFIVSNVSAQKEESGGKTDTSNVVTQKIKTLIAYYLVDLFFTRELTFRTELFDNEGNGAFRSRWRFIYSNPFGDHYSLVTEVPVVLAVPSNAKSVAGLGSISILFQGEFGKHNIVSQIAGLRVFLPTGSHPQTGGNLLMMNPRYQVDLFNYKYILPSFLIEYYHSVIQINKAAVFRVLALRPIIAIKQLAPEKIGLSGRVEVEWNFDFHSDQNGGILYILLAKQLNPTTLISFEFSPALSDFTRKTLWERRYTVSVLISF